MGSGMIGDKIIKGMRNTSVISSDLECELS